MEEIITALQQIADSMGQNAVPMWLTIMMSILPIILTVITIWLSICMHIQNKELQKQLHNRDVVNQSRKCMLEIYNAYVSALNIACQADKYVADVFSNDQSYYQWGMTVQNARVNVMGAYNRAKLMVGADSEMIDYLKKSFDVFADLDATVGRYVGTGIPSQTIQNAWSEFFKKYGIFSNNYGVLYSNRVMHEEFIKLCENSYTHEIQDKITAYIDLVGCDGFDKYFEKYVRIENI